MNAWTCGSVIRCFGVLLLVLQVSSWQQRGSRNPKGSLRLQPFNFPSKVVNGNTVTVTCTTISSTANVNFRWLKDGKEIVESSKTKIVHHSLFSTLVIGPTSREDGGNYTCVGNKGEDVDSHSQQLDILAPPEWLVEPQDVKLHQGGNVTVICEATGNPTPAVKWTFLARKGDNRDTKVSGKNLLQIANASKLDAGSYECTANNGVSEAISKSILVSIYEKPVQLQDTMERLRSAKLGHFCVRMGCVTT